MKSQQTKPKPEKAAGIVKTVVALSLAVGMTTRTIGVWKRSEGFPVRPDGCYSIWEVAAWYWSVGPGSTKLETDEAGMSGPSSENLERWRGEKFQLARLQRLELERKLVPADLVSEVFAIVASKLRSLGERLDPDAAKDLRDVIDEIDGEASAWIDQNIGETAA